MGLDRGDGKRPDGLTTFPFKSGKCLAWDATCTDTFADSAVAGSALRPGTAARAAETRKVQRYSSLTSQYLFVPLAVETSGVIGPAAIKFVKELGRMITCVTGDQRETAWLWQRLSMAIVRGNAAAIRGSAPQTSLGAAIPNNHRYSTIAQQSNVLLTTDLRPPSPDREVSPRPEVSPPSPTSPEVSHRPPHRLSEYQQIYNQMRDEPQDRDPMSDPELARYLTR